MTTAVVDRSVSAGTPEPAVSSTASGEHDSEQGRRTPRRPRRAPKAPVVLPMEESVDPKVLERLAKTYPDAAERLGEALIRGQRVLDDEDKAHLAQLVNEGAKTLTPVLADTAMRAKAEAALKNRVNFVCDFVDRREGEIARRRYAIGLGLGVALTAVVLFVVGVGSPLVIRYWLQMTNDSPGTVTVDHSNWLALRDTLVAIGGGAAGAAVSVLLRLNRVPDLKIETVRISTAMVRILLGWFFALALLALVKGGITAELFHDPSTALLNADPKVDNSAAVVGSWFFWGAIGFLAGFNERWATTIIARDPAGQSTKTAQSGASKP